MLKRTLTSLALAVTLMTLSSGCTTANPRHKNVHRILESHQKGFEDAVLASPEAEAFVKESLTTIANLEGELIRRE